MLKEVLKSLISKPITVQSLTTNESVPISDRYRGKLEYDRDACIGCLLCIRVCPAGTISNTDQRKVEFRLDRCIFCGQCSEICPKDAIKMSLNGEIIVTDREQLLLK